PAFIGATVAPHRRSLKAKLHTISNPEGRDLMPLLNKPIMIIALDTKHQMLNNIVRGENQLTRTNYLLHRFAVFASRVRIKEDFGRTSSLFHVSGKELSPSKLAIKFDACSPGVRLRSDPSAKSLHL
ncbi:unnamed protein product, partial [Porites lobata]